jgi:hypothetical protein
VKTESGQLIQCVVKAIDKPRSIVHLSSDEDLISKSIVWLILVNGSSVYSVLSVITNL